MNVKLKGAKKSSKKLICTVCDHSDTELGIINVMKIKFEILDT